ncbi:hypothetical protein EG850_04245 [Gulosibacter macacae]|uniref:Uncharacterized protein n=1 Tax=Gulosibacter macacae TaxID=2488791 RepID=A0A3P3W1F2_9MICO|nr:hypothetical protein [Gulosibacter macacae]RRJ87519.1 hypothetical protein EG850_04245 [Gulosibacter macacae]
MALRSDSPAPDAARDDAALSGTVDGRSLPEHTVKRVTAAVLAVVLLVTLFVPWWLTDPVVRLEFPVFAGWQLFAAGLGIAPFAGYTGFSVFGNVLLGVVPVLPLLVLIALLVVRATKPRALPGTTIVLWAVFAFLAAIWLVVLGWARLNATQGEHPATWGLLIATIVSLFTATAFGNWWRLGEKSLWPRRGGLRLGAAEEPNDGDALTTEQLLQALDEEDAAKPAPDDEGDKPSR